MKHFYSLLLALGLSSLCAMGQNVIVVLTDGTTKKFNADYVSEIQFKEAPVNQLVEFSDLKISPSSNGSAQLDFSDPESKTSCSLWIRSQGSATWLLPGTYVTDSETGEFSIDSYYSTVTRDEETQKVESGEMKIELEGNIYSFSLEFTLKDGSEFKGTYSGELSTYTQHLELTASAAKYNDNPHSAGNFYIKLNDAAWTYEMALDIFADPEATTLPAGEYNYSADEGLNTIGPKSYVDFYTPYSSNKLVSGSKMTVSESAAGTLLDMNFIFEDGRTAHITFDGAISGTPVFN